MALGDPGAIWGVVNHYKVRYTSVAFATKVINTINIFHNIVINIVINIFLA